MGADELANHSFATPVKALAHELHKPIVLGYSREQTDEALEKSLGRQFGEFGALSVVPQYDEEKGGPRLLFRTLLEKFLETQS